MLVLALENARNTAEKHYAAGKPSGTFQGCRAYGDFREVLARDDVDAVMISTPDHWHVPMSLAAVEAGKDVCCEKPLTRTIAEGRKLSDAVTKHQRVFRVDSEFRHRITTTNPAAPIGDHQHTGVHTVGNKRGSILIYSLFTGGTDREDGYPTGGESARMCARKILLCVDYGLRNISHLSADLKDS